MRQKNEYTKDNNITNTFTCLAKRYEELFINEYQKIDTYLKENPTAIKIVSSPKNIIFVKKMYSRVIIKYPLNNDITRKLHVKGMNFKPKVSEGIYTFEDDISIQNEHHSIWTSNYCAYYDSIKNKL